MGALRAFQIDLNGASVPDSFAATNEALKQAVAKGIEGMREVQRAVHTRRRADWLRARDSLGASDALMERAFELAPASDRP